MTKLIRISERGPHATCMAMTAPTMNSSLPGWTSLTRPNSPFTTRRLTPCAMVRVMGTQPRS